MNAYQMDLRSSDLRSIFSRDRVVRKNGYVSISERVYAPPGHKKRKNKKNMERSAGGCEGKL